MSVNFGSILLLLLGLFIAKISFENMGNAQANENKRSVQHYHVE